jgi:ribulose-phosphate 3-epimerase
MIMGTLTAERAKKISPSILSADFTRLGEEIRAVETGGADYIHVDVMDGHFVPNLTIGPFIVKAVRRCTGLPLDVHLMIDRPDDFISDFAEAGANILTVHVETVVHLHRTLTEIRRKGMRPGVSLNPATPPCLIEPVLEYVDLILVMSVNPGFGGQEFIPGTLSKIAELRRMIDKTGRAVELEVDGGIKSDNIAGVSRAGANVFVSGSGIFQTPDYAETIASMRRAIQRTVSPQRAQSSQRKK